MIQNLIDYIKASRAELKHANWPTRKETIRFTGLVIGVSIAVAFFLGSADMLFAYLLERFVL
jgi:preprotein translocase subunit SecE